EKNFSPSGRAHLILDLLSMEWFMDVAYEEQEELPSPLGSTQFIYNNDIWTIGSPTEFYYKSDLFRFDLQAMEWIKMGRIRLDCSDRILDHPVTVGRRVFFMRGAPADNIGCEDTVIYPLEFDPTLFILAAVAISRSKQLIIMARKILPKSIANELLSMSDIFEIYEDDEDSSEEEEDEEENDNVDCSNVDCNVKVGDNVREEDDEIPPKRNRVE
ncbi:hypothetical protein PENTCL1PPCAC_3208, partial [Pristionchus entomophagus]